ncbi:MULTISPECIES: ABC transporter permease [unclassified Rathayibacter]|uniref:ABC transporter permease n=1 Tax=unclassified Rathayibacter TaxID=2609250 RepID=UPI000CE7FF5D|nr:MULTISPECIES: ABC transporter permease [unclassified Rathayibacter]PPF29729.1 ABC transporter permease [Rathayibacter sp. AY1F2]PPG54327.1 ABC transporter permease [Rathayibacter sp. AY1E9]PPH42986.1 ABC transporter permease [Rathayibacter sp. AY1F7]
MTTTHPRAAHAPTAESSAPPTPARGAATIVRREILTRTGNRTILTATLALAAIAGLGAGIGGWFLVDATREAGTVVLDTRILFATAMISALLAAMVYSSSSLASGVVEEKSSRIVEILLTKIGVAPLLAGKMIGVGLVTLAQLLVIGGAVVGGFSVVGGWSVLEIELGPSLVWFLVWFLQGYVLFALLSTLLASTVSRQEDLGTAAMPLSVVQMALLIIALYVVPANLDEAWVHALSFVPLFSSYLMPMRFGLDSVGTPEMVIAAVVAAITVPLLFRLVVRVYRNNALRTGSRVSLRASLKAADAS